MDKAGTDSDRIFIRNFSWVIAALALFTVVMVILAGNLQDQIISNEAPSRERALLSRIEPVGDVYAGDTGRAAMLAAQEAAAAASVQQVAFDGALDAELIYDSVCATCHDTGVSGSPKLERSAWQARIDQGMETLVTHAVEGYTGDAGIMPAKGGRTDLTDEQVAITVEYMLDQLQ